jgi:hypothetical protein
MSKKVTVQMLKAAVSIEKQDLIKLGTISADRINTDDQT